MEVEDILEIRPDVTYQVLAVYRCVIYGQNCLFLYHFWPYICVGDIFISLVTCTRLINCKCAL